MTLKKARSQPFTPGRTSKAAWKLILGTRLFPKPKSAKKIWRYGNREQRKREVRKIQAYIDERAAKLKPKTRGKKRNGGPGGYLKRNSASAKDIHRFLWVKRQIWCSPRSIARDMA